VTSILPARVYIEAIGCLINAYEQPLVLMKSKDRNRGGALTVVCWLDLGAKKQSPDAFFPFSATYRVNAGRNAYAG
jgi:hypothetical protein